MSAVNVSALTPPGQHPPFAVVTPTDHEAWVIIAAALGTCLSLVFAAIRIFIRYTGGSKYGLDDWVTAAATVWPLLVPVPAAVTAARTP